MTTDGVLHQRDATPEEQAENEILQKVILPHIRGYARIEGSNFDARDFILITAGEGDAKIDERPGSVAKGLARQGQAEEPGIGRRDCGAVTFADLKPPTELAEQISQRELARVEREKNVVRIGQFKAEQELTAKESLKQQATEKVGAETRLIQGKTKSEQLKAVEESRLKQELANTQLKLDAAEIRPKPRWPPAAPRPPSSICKTTPRWPACAPPCRALARRCTSPSTRFSKLSPALTEIFASDQSDFGKIFSEFMSARARRARRPPATTPASVTGTNSARETRP